MERGESDCGIAWSIPTRILVLVVSTAVAIGSIYASRIPYGVWLRVSLSALVAVPALIGVLCAALGGTWWLRKRCAPRFWLFLGVVAMGVLLAAEHETPHMAPLSEVLLYTRVVLLCLLVWLLQKCRGASAGRRNLDPSEHVGE